MRLTRAGDVSLSRGQLYDAIENYNRAIGLLPGTDLDGFVDLNLRLGRAQSQLGDCQGARESLRQVSHALGSEPDHTAARMGAADEVRALCPGPT
jgi:hypothetical protein